MGGSRTNPKQECRLTAEVRDGKQQVLCRFHRCTIREGQSRMFGCVEAWAKMDALVAEATRKKRFTRAIKGVLHE